MYLKGIGNDAFYQCILHIHRLPHETNHPTLLARSAGAGKTGAGEQLRRPRAGLLRPGMLRAAGPRRRAAGSAPRGAPGRGGREEGAVESRPCSGGNGNYKEF